MLKKLSNILFGKLTYKKFIGSELNFNQLDKEDQDNIILELKQNNIPNNQIEYILNNKKNIFHCYRLPLKDFPIYFYDNINSYGKQIIKYIDSNKISEEYYCELRSILRAYFKYNDKYVTNSELNRYLNKEIKFENIRDRYEELSQAKTQEEYLKIINDYLI